MVALARLGVQFEHVFSSDSDKHCRQFIEHARKPKHLFQDVLTRTDNEEEYTDVYIWTPPCQDISSGGKQRGLKGARRTGDLVKKSLMYIKSKRPRVSLFENVAAMNHKQFRFFYKGLVKTLKALNYKVFTTVLDSRDHCVPQVRKRCYCVAIRADCARRPFTWPDKQPIVDINSIWGPESASDVPGRLPTNDGSKDARNHAIKAYRYAYSTGHDPRIVPVMVDIDATPRFGTYGISFARTLTRTRGGSGGPWVSSRGRRVSITEMMKLQGYIETDIPWETAGLTKRQIGQMLGNSVSVPVVGAILSDAMYSAGVTSKRVCLE